MSLAINTQAISTSLGDYQLNLTASGSTKLVVIKAVREITGLGLKEAKTLVDNAPSVIPVPSNVDITDAAQTLKDAGAEVNIETPLTKEKIKDLISLAPLHNPANLEGIEVAEQIFPSAEQVAVFDTAYHQTIPEVAHRFAIDKKIADQEKIRVYGFHGTSHKYVAAKTREFLGEAQSEKLINIHLGNGCSVTAIKDGKSFDHSLGFGPVNGLIMGTRSGDIDQSVIFYLMDRLGYTSAEANTFIQKKAGMLGLTGHSDLRDIESAAADGNKDCQLDA